MRAASARRRRSSSRQARPPATARSTCRSRPRAPRTRRRGAAGTRSAPRQPTAFCYVRTTMGIVGKASVRCPACGLEQDSELVQSINTRSDAAVKRRLLAGELNVLACVCGRRTQLAANVLFHDPDADYYCQVVPGDETAMAEAAAAFRVAGAAGTQRLVPSL